jgi:hypothetical protein
LCKHGNRKQRIDYFILKVLKYNAISLTNMAY